MNKRLLGGWLALVLLISLLAGVTLPAGAENTYPSVADYMQYQNTDVKDFSIGSKAEWLAAVAMSDHTNAEITPVDFAGCTLHFTADIDMANEPMLPLCYGGIFNASVNGHGHVIKNISITIENAAGPVGLIAMLAKNRSIQNLGVEGGKITVTGLPTYRAEWGIKDSGNKVGALVGRVGAKGTLVRNCWNSADISVVNIDNVGGIVGDGRSLSYMDNCFNIGFIGGNGLIGYAAATTDVTNCISEGSSLATRYHVNMLGVKTAEEFLQNTYTIASSILNYTGSESTYTDEQKQARATINAARVVDVVGEAAYKVNQNYVQTDLGDGARVWYTVDENGKLAFGTEQNQVRKITIKSEGKPDETIYVAAGRTVELGYDLDATYFALQGNYQATTLAGNKLTLGNEDVTLLAGCGVYMGDANSNGTIELHDAITVLRKVVGENEACDAKAGDVNQNARLDANDAVLLVRGWLKDPQATFKPEAPADTSDWIKVVSYNIKVLTYNHENPSTRIDQFDEVVAVLRAADADIVGLQEVDYFNSRSGSVDQVKKLAEELGYPYYQFVGTINSGGGKYGHAIMSRYPIEGYDVYRFADAPGDIDGAEPRAVGRFRLDVNGKELIFYNGHLANSTAAQLKYLNDTYMQADADAGKNVVMTADFNMFPWSFKGCYDTQKFTALNGGDDFNSCLGTTTNEVKPIDNIIVSDDLDYYWDQAADNGVKVVRSTASDHSLIYSYIRMK